MSLWNIKHYLALLNKRGLVNTLGLINITNLHLKCLCFWIILGSCIMFMWAHIITITVLSLTAQSICEGCICYSATAKLRGCVCTQEYSKVPRWSNTAGMYSNWESQCWCGLSLLLTWLLWGCAQDQFQMMLIGCELSCDNKDTKNKNVWWMRSAVFEIVFLLNFPKKVHFIDKLTSVGLIKTK